MTTTLEGGRLAHPAASRTRRGRHLLCGHPASDTCGAQGFKAIRLLRLCGAET